MIVKDRTKLNERCCMCKREIPYGSLSLRKVENGEVLCLLCLVEIADLPILK